MKLVTRAAAGTAEWHQARRGVITASRAANILAGEVDIPGYRSRLQEWHDLKAELDGTAAPVEPDPEEGEAEPDEERNEFMQWGLDSEPLHLKKLGALIGETLESFGAIVEDDEFPWLRASPDCITQAVRELKAVCGGAAKKWADGVPYMHQCQLAVQQRVSGLHDDGIVSGYIVRGFSPPSIHYERFDLTERSEHFVLGTLEAFWKSVLDDIPPTPVAADYDAQRSARKTVAGKRCKLPMEFIDRWRILELREEEMVKPFEAERKALMAEIVAEMGDSELGIAPDGTGFTLKGSRRPRMKATDEYFVTKPSLKFSEKAAWK